MKNNELYAWIGFLTADYIFNQNRTLRSMVKISMKIQRQKHEKLKLLDNDCFGC